MPSASSLEVTPSTFAGAAQRTARAPQRGLRTVTIGLLGFGNVGQAVARLATDDRLHRQGWRFHVAGALVRDAGRTRQVPLPVAVTEDPSVFLRGRYDVVIEALDDVGTGGRLDGDQARREFDLSRDQVGSVVEVEPLPNGWLAATSRGLLEIDSQTKSVRTLVTRPILGLARGPAERFVFTDGVSLYVASATTLGSGRVDAELRLGRGFKPQRIRAHGGRAVVLGARDTVWVDLRSPTPRLIARIGGRETGRVLDAATIQNRRWIEEKY